MAEALRQADPGVAIAYVGRVGGPESWLVPQAGIEFSGLRLGSMGAGPLSSAPRLAARLPLAYGQAHAAIRRFRPQVILATGGYVCVPVVLAGRRRRLPVLMLEQNLLPGRAVRWLARRVQLVATSFPETAAMLPGARTRCIGNPVRLSFVRLAGPRPHPEAPPNLLVMGGSQGARHLNQVLLEALPELLQIVPQIQVSHLTGPDEHDAVVTEAERRGLPLGERYQALGFATDVAQRLARASLVVMRAGASSLSEVACLGRPMILVPYPHAGEHQTANAVPYAKAGAARLIPDHDLGPGTLTAVVRSVLETPGALQAMARASAALARPQAAAGVAGLLVELARGGSPA